MNRIGTDKELDKYFQENKYEEETKVFILNNVWWWRPLANNS